MKKLFLTGLMAAAFLVACENSKHDSVQEAESQNEQKMKDSTTMSMALDQADEEFAVKLAAGGMEEIELGKLAEEKGMLKEVKEFGKHMVHQHTQLGDELMAVAKKKNITLPDSLSAEGKKDKEDLMKLKGREFDQKYMGAMVEGHKKVLAAVEKENADTKDPDMKAFTEKAILMIKEHLQMAEMTDSLAKAENKGGKKKMKM